MTLGSIQSQVFCKTLDDSWLKTLDNKLLAVRDQIKAIYSDKILGKELFSLEDFSKAVINKTGNLDPKAHEEICKLSQYAFSQADKVIQIQFKVNETVTWVLQPQLVDGEISNWDFLDLEHKINIVSDEFYKEQVTNFLAQFYSAHEPLMWKRLVEEFSVFINGLAKENPSNDALMTLINKFKEELDKRIVPTLDKRIVSTSENSWDKDNFTNLFREKLIKITPKHLRDEVRSMQGYSLVESRIGAPIYIVIMSLFLANIKEANVIGIFANKFQQAMRALATTIKEADSDTDTAPIGAALKLFHAHMMEFPNYPRSKLRGTIEETLQFIANLETPPKKEEAEIETIVTPRFAGLSLVEKIKFGTEERRQFIDDFIDKLISGAPLETQFDIRARLINPGHSGRGYTSNQVIEFLKKAVASAESPYDIIQKLHEHMNAVQYLQDLKWGEVRKKTVNAAEEILQTLLQPYIQ